MGGELAGGLDGAGTRAGRKLGREGQSGGGAGRENGGDWQGSGKRAKIWQGDWKGRYKSGRRSGWGMNLAGVWQGGRDYNNATSNWQGDLQEIYRNPGK